MIEKKFLEDQAIRRCDLIIRGFTTFENENMREFAEICKQALEEIQQYRELGTVEELEAMKKGTLSAMELADIWCVSEDLKKYSAIGTVEEFKALKDAEEQGLLLRLPCKVGDTVYEISRVEPYRNPAIREMGVIDIILRDDDIYFTLQDLHDEYYDNSILITEFGKTVFFTREEAKQALEKLKGGAE